MKKITAYFLGVLTGLVLSAAAVFVLAIYGLSDRPEPIEEAVDPNMTKFDVTEPLEYTSVEVFQVLDNGNALARANDVDFKSLDSFTGPVVLLEAGDLSYYDGQIIRAKSSQQFCRIGEYRYKSGGGMNKTVPIVTLKSK